MNVDLVIAISIWTVVMTIIGTIWVFYTWLRIRRQIKNFENIKLKVQIEPSHLNTETSTVSLLFADKELDDWYVDKYVVELNMAIGHLERSLADIRAEKISSDRYKIIEQAVEKLKPLTIRLSEDNRVATALKIEQQVGEEGSRE